MGSEEVWVGIEEGMGEVRESDSEKGSWYFSSQGEISQCGDRTKEGFFFCLFRMPGFYIA